MKNKVIALTLLFFFSCGISKPEKSDYNPFICLKHPENRVYMPEESIVIGFNNEINPYTVKGIKVIEPESKAELPVKVDGKNIVVIPPLFPESTVAISINQSLKSIDNKPLMIGEKFSENKETLNFEIKTGPKLTEIVEIIPKNTESATVGFLFDSKAKVGFENINPLPVDLIQLDDWLILSYKKPVSSITLSNVLSVKRDETVDEIHIYLPGTKKPQSKELNLDYTVDDNSISISVKDDSAIAARVGNLSLICLKSCNFFLGNLKHETSYVYTLTVFTTTNIKEKQIAFTTKPKKPHIMISEIMHSPLKKPEKNWEFIELYNNSTMDFDLTNCFVDDKNDGKGKDPLILKKADTATPILKPGKTALITGNEALFGDLDTLWLIVDDTTIADRGLSMSETVQIICEKEGIEVLEAQVDLSTVDTEKGYSVNFDTKGNKCSSKNKGGTPGKYLDCI